MTIRYLAISILLALSVPGCVSVPIASIWDLRHFDFRTTDFDRLRVAVSLPEAIKPRPAGVNMNVIAKLDGEPDTATVFHLVEVRDAAEMADLPRDDRPGFTTYAYRLSPSDVRQLEAMRAAAFRKHDEGKHGSIGMGIATKEFCRIGSLPSGSLPVSTYLMTSETGHYVVVTRDMDLRSIDQSASELVKLEPCEAIAERSPNVNPHPNSH